VHYEYIGSAFFGPKLGQLMFHLILPYHVLKRSFDVWMESFTPPFSTSFLPLFTRKPVVGLGHMLSGEDMRRKYGFPFQLIEHLGLRCYRYIIVTSEHFRKRILRLNPRACTEVIQNGINLQEFKEPSESSRRGFSFLGRIEVDQKGLDLLLQAYALFAQTEEVVPLYIAGTGNHKEMVKLRRLIKEHHLQEHVVFKGWVSGKERIGFLQQSLGNIVSSRFETFSLVALETLAAGTPLIAFDIPGIRWIPDECALKVPVFETRALADALVKVVRDEKERDRLTLAGQEFSKSFDWKQKASQYEHFIRTVLGQYASSHHQ
jgi:glycosyltransferase involved in cell wall biosynthesis